MSKNRVLRPRRPVAASVLALWLAVSACADSSGPEPAPSSLVATTAMEQSATVGTVVPAVPAVVVRDTEGKAVSGVPVTFAVAAGGGTLGQTTVTTGPDGAAGAGSWTLGTTAGIQTVTAQAAGLPVVTFSASAKPAEPSKISVAAGADQTGRTGTPVATAPAVVIRDRYDNAVPGVAVTFEIESGGGAVTGAAATTDAGGRASVGGWKLGVVPGEQRLRARAGSVSTTILATAMLPTGCTVAAYELGAAIPATWADSDCRSSRGTSYDQYEVTLTEQQRFRVQLSGPNGRGIFVDRKEDGHTVASMPMEIFAPATANPLEIEYAFAPGTYTFRVFAPSGQTTGEYTLRSMPATGIVCRPITFGTPGITVSGTINPATDCRSPGSTEWYEDWLVMILKTGDKLRFTMTTTEMAPLLVWRDDREGPASPTLKVVSSPTPGTIVLDWTATFDGFHEMVISRASPSTPYGAYTLKVERLP